MLAFLLIAIVLMRSGPSYAGILGKDDIEDLEGKTVVYAGEFETFPCTIGKEYVCPIFGGDLMRAKSKHFCFSTNFSGCSYSCKGLIAVGKDNTPTLYIIDRNKFEKGTVERIPCPSVF